MASVLKVDKLDPQSGTALEIGTSGDTVTVPSGATLDISSATLTPPATLPASSGVNLTALNASNLGSGTVPTARLGSGTASSSTVLYGDQTYKAEPTGGKIHQVVRAFASGELMTSSTFNSVGLYATITPSSASSSLLVWAFSPAIYNNGTEPLYAQIWKGTSGEGSGATIGGLRCQKDATEYSPSTMTAYVPASGVTTDATTFTVMHKNSNNSTLVGWYDNVTGCQAELVILEILA